MKIIFTLLVIASTLGLEKPKPIGSGVNSNCLNPNEDTIKKTLDDEILTMEVYPMRWLFNAPNWIEKSVLSNGDSIRISNCFYLEPDDSLEFPQLSIDFHFKVTGQFYSQPFCPTVIYDPDSIGYNDKCLGRAFRFTEIKAIYHGTSNFEFK